MVRITVFGGPERRRRWSTEELPRDDQDENASHPDCRATEEQRRILEETRIKRSTVHLATAMPSRRNWCQTLREP